MSLSNDINTTSTALSDIKDAIIAKGVTPSGNITTYATAISQISGGGSANIDELNVTPSTSAQTITATGGVDGYSPVNVSAVTSSIDANIVASNIKDGVTILGVTGEYSGSGGGGYSELPTYQVTEGVASRRTIDLQGTEFDGIEEIGAEAMAQLFSNNDGVTGDVVFSDLITIGDNGLFNAFNYTNVETVSFPELTTVDEFGMGEAFTGCSYLTSVDLSALETVGATGLSGAFSSCTSLTSVDLSALTTVDESGLMGAFIDSNISGALDLSALTTVGFQGLSGAFRQNKISSVDLSALTTIDGEGLKDAFAQNKIQTVTFDSLNYVGANGLETAFDSNFDTSTHSHTMQSVSFPSLTSQSFDSGDETAFDGMINGANGATVHFPSNLQSVIGSWSSVTSGFGGTNTTVLFDLPATE